MAITLVLLILLLLIIVFRYIWKRRDLYILAYNLPGPPALPIFGNGLSVMFCKQEDILSTMNKISASYPKPFRFWIGPVLSVYFTNPEHIQKILSSTKFNQKHDLYDFIKSFFGEGLISGSGEKNKQHRRLIQPLINIKFVTENMNIFQKHVNICMNKLDAYCDKGTFDVYELPHQCFVDIIGESFLGIQINAQQGENVGYSHACAQLYTMTFDRYMRVWLYPDVIYNRTNSKIEYDRILTLTRNFTRDALLKAYERMQSTDMKVHQSSPMIDQIVNLNQANPSVMNDKDFIDHMFTMYCASEDTMSLITAMLLVCFGMYPEYQQRAVDEIKYGFKSQHSVISYEDLTKLKYLDMCVRDVLRLLPVATIIIRKPSESVDIGVMTLPKDCAVFISIFEVHRDPKHWENPNHFHPDHFLPEVVTQRHPFAYIPFSAGPRNCIGKIVAFAGLKFMMANILRRYEIEADGKFPDIVLKSDISARSVNGYKVRIKRRNFD